MTQVLDQLMLAFEGRYRLERELGRGGMATVYLAQDLKLDRRVALKVLSPKVAHALGAERFLREIRVTAGFDHPHILPLLDSGQAGTLLYYLMPYVVPRRRRAPGMGATLRGATVSNEEMP